jgi:transposase
MLTFGFPRRIFLCRQPTDMRKSFDSLAGLVQMSLQADPLSGDAYIFVGKHRNRVKILVFDRSGYWVLAKRLCSGRFGDQGAFRSSETSGAVELSPGELQLLIEGIEIRTATYRRQYQHPVASSM